jgi:uncharacterized membrane protein
LEAKSLAAIGGTVASLALIVTLAVVFVGAAQLTGRSPDSSQLLVTGGDDFSLQGLILAGMVIGALASSTTSPSRRPASTVMALRRADPGLPFRRMYRGALGVGQDHAAAAVNTLVVAYVGASLPALLVLGLAYLAPGQPLNTEAVAGADHRHARRLHRAVGRRPDHHRHREPPRHAPVRPQERVS